METKTFDAVQDTRRWREAASRRLNSLSREERMAYFQRLGHEVRARLKRRPRASSES